MQFLIQFDICEYISAVRLLSSENMMKALVALIKSLKSKMGLIGL